MIKQDQQKRILSLGFKIKIYSTSLEEGSKEGEEGSSKPTWMTFSLFLKISSEDPSMGKVKRVEGRLIKNNPRISQSDLI